MAIEKRTVVSPKGDITIFRLTNSRGHYVELSTVGAGIVGVYVPDKNGKIENVALSYAKPEEYFYDGPCMGKIPGRYANRIAGGKFSIGDLCYQLAINNGPNALHGGPEGFQNQIWQAREEDDNNVVFSYNAREGEECYPGNLHVQASYSWDDNDCLTLRISATTDKTTIVNLTNHAYWNLNGADSGSVLAHTLQMKASRYLPTDSTLIPTGEKAPVEDTPMDFLAPEILGLRIKDTFPALEYGKGYDACWVIDEWIPGKMTENVAVLRSPESGRVLRVDTTQPGVQIYTGNWLAGSPVNASGRSYDDYDGVAIECQGFPDSPNKPNFPSQLLYPEQTYEQEIRFRFETEA